MRSGKPDPIDAVKWVDVGTLNPNGYNPNVVYRQELNLLERSILKNGWVQPILVTPLGTIIDGFHRYSLSRDSKKLRDIYDGLVPVAVLDISEAEAKCLTVRINRAKGEHIGAHMAALVMDLIGNHKMSDEEIAAEIGATVAEVRHLAGESIFKQRNLANVPYSKAWVAANKEDGSDDFERPEGVEDDLADADEEDES